MANAIPLETDSVRRGPSADRQPSDTRTLEAPSIPAGGERHDSPAPLATWSDCVTASCDACTAMRAATFQCTACHYVGAPLVAACICSIDKLDAEIARCEHHLQQINASGRDSYREHVLGTTRTIKHTRREIERRLAALTHSRIFRATGDAGFRGLLECPCCGASDLAESDREVQERRAAFVRDMLQAAEPHRAYIDLFEVENRVWKLATRYIA